jgi:hypothetical protein
MSKDGYVLLGSFTSPSTGTNNTFTNIPAGYDSLTIRGNLQAGTNNFWLMAQMRLNSNSSSIYDNWRYYMGATSIDYGWDLLNNAGDIAYIGGAYLGDWPCQVETTIFGANNPDTYTKWVTVFGYGGGGGGYGAAGCIGGVWKDTSVVTSIECLGYWYADTIINLYGRRT